MNTGKKRELVNQLMQAYAFEEMQHAFRFNGVIDVYKGYSLVVYDNHKKRMNKFDSLSDMKSFVLHCLDTYPKIEKYKAPKYIDYRSFKRQIMPANTSNGTAEEYHWKFNKDLTSDDSLYLLFHQDKVKIGRSKDVVKRMKTFSTGLANNFDCYEIKNKGCMEKKMHHCFSEFNTNREWFDSNYRIRQFVENRLISGECIKVEVPLRRVAKYT